MSAGEKMMPGECIYQQEQNVAICNVDGDIVRKPLTNEMNNKGRIRGMLGI